MNAPRKVALLIETSNSYGRDLLYGVRDWMHEGERWAIRLTEQVRRAPLPAWLHDWRGDGIIARVDSETIASALRRTKLPVVDVSAERFASEFPRVSIDNAAVARLAAEHLAGKGFAHLAFCGDARFLWSGERGEAFRTAAAKLGRDCAVFAPRRGRDGAPGTDADLRAVAAWIAVLPKPAGIFACYDGRAQQVLEACQQLGLAVPEQVAVLGVDNDEVLCDLSNPPLSSVQPNARRTGYEAAAMLAAMMRGGRAPRRTRYVEPLRVVERPSTDVVSVDDPKVAAALRFIRLHATEGINVKDVLKAVPISRTLLERKCRRRLGRSLHALILQEKIERARQLLAESELSIRVVAELTGFGAASYLSVVFRRETGEGPLAYRVRHRSGHGTAGG